MKIALTPPQKPNRRRMMDILLALCRTPEPVRFECVARACARDARAPGLHLSHKTHSRQRANQLAHFQREQRAGQLCDRKPRAFRERIDLHGRISPE